MDEKSRYDKNGPVWCIFCNKQSKHRRYYLKHLGIHTGERPYFCKFCSQEFSDYDCWRRHELDHKTGEIRKKKKCHLCGKKFQILRDLDKHVRRHLGVKPFKCNTCSRSYKTEEQLKTHSFNHIKRFECLQCNKKFKTQNYLGKHIKTIHEHEKNYKCSFCDRSFGQEANLAKHLLVHTQEKPYKCQQCPERFTSSQHLKHHIRRKHSTDPSQKIAADCVFCEEKFKWKCTEITHLYIHTGERPFFCRFCSKELRSGLSLKYHEDTHTEQPRPFKCSVCGDSFKTSIALNSHTAGVHAKDRRFQCDICEKAFKTKTCLRNHKKVHRAPGFDCEHCGKRYKSLNSVKSHILSAHEKRRPYECSLCPKKFSQSANLATHMTRHTGEKSFSCTTCNKLFSTSSALSSHRLVHIQVADEDMKSCPECGIRCKFKSYLRVHMKLHKIETHECIVCLKLFPSRDKLRGHLKRHLNERPFWCKYCSKEFAEKGSLKHHIAVAH